MRLWTVAIFQNRATFNIQDHMRASVLQMHLYLHEPASCSRNVVLLEPQKPGVLVSGGVRSYCSKTYLLFTK